VGAKLLCSVAVLAILAPRPSRGAPEDYEGKRIVRILFDPALQPLSDDELAEMLPIKVGEPLSLRALRDAIVRLYDTGRYRDIAADAELSGDGVLVRFLTRNTWFVGRVSVEGVPAPPNEGQLVNATRLDLGRRFSEEAAQRAIGHLEEVLRANGFFEPKVQRFVEYEQAFSQVNVVFLVEPGPRARLAAPVLKGADPEEARRLVKATRWARFWVLPGWKEATERRVQKGLERIRKYYQKRNRLLSSVTLEEMLYDSESRSVTPVLRISPGPKIHVHTVGWEVSQSKLRELVPIFQEQAVDRDLLAEGARNLTQFFQAKGYFDAKVTFENHQEPGGETAIVYHIETGPRYKLTRLEIRGNEYFDEATLRERMAVTPATRLRYRRGRFSQAMLERDLATIAALYRANGFRDVKVTAKTEATAGNELSVVVQIDEGPQWRVAELRLDGVSPANREDVELLMTTIPGQPFSEAAMAADRDNILAYYYDNGYLNARFDWDAKLDPQTHTVDVNVAIEEGPRRYVRASLIGGLKETRPSLVYSRILLKPGEPLSQSLMIETQRRLYDLGIFARVDQAIQNAEGNEERKYLIHQFEEARRYSVNLGLGAQIARIGGGGFTDFDNPAGTPGFSPRISVGVTRSNMFGVGHTAGLQARVSNTRRRALFNYFAPQFKGNENYNVTVSGLYDFSRDINTFESRRWEGSVQFGHRLSRADSFRYRFTYRRVGLGNVRISPELIPIFAQPVRVGLVAADFIQDKRDDPLSSTRGYYNAIETSVASKIFGSETDYVQIIGRNSSYHRIGRDLVLARSLTIGWLGNPASDGLNNPIPLPERIFSGGASSHRGFPDNQAGPRDLETGFPLGGRALVMHNLELRFPLIGDSIGGVLFHDAGNVYSSFGAISFRFRQRDKTDFDYMVHAFGFGIRYQTPIGPIRLDLAYAPNSPRFFGFKGSLEDLIAGRGQKVDQRISQFQFFFSIGQTF